MSATTLFVILIVFLSLEFFFEKWLDILNAKHYKDPIPSNLIDIFNEEEYFKSQKYKFTNFKFHLIESIFSFLFIIILLSIGFFGKIDQWIVKITSNTILQSVLFFILLYIGSWIISLPFSFYQTFWIEEKFGFNKTTKKLFIGDALKNLLIGIILIIILGGSITWIYYKTGENFWLYALAVMSFFILLINLFYTSVFLPLFNKLNPLEEGSLKKKLSLLAHKTKYKIDKIFVIDGSKRSTKANAFFSGLGPKKKVVLYDTLLEDLTPEEVTAVLAHEIGHYKKKHIIFNLLLSLFTTGVFLYLFSLFINNKDLAYALGANRSSFHIGLIAFGILFIPISFILNIITNYLSRKFEYQADNYAKQYWKKEELVSALKKLSKKSLSNLTPHKCYVFFHYSHPPLKDRINALLSENK